ncbi:MAG: hypothetical protein DRO88_04615 [Promethearchaeia archaeon]|nr:MAG: hypothetical protein DRO88_04615 [Candidatus Lokiarchaeia archaeon]
MSSTKKTAKKTATKKSSTKKVAVKKSSTKKVAVKKSSTKKITAKKSSIKKAAVKKSSTKKAAAKKITAVPVKESKPKVEEKPKETSITVPKEKKETSNMQVKMAETWNKVKTSVAKVPHGIEEPENKLKITTSKLFALIGALFAFFEGRTLFLTYNVSPVFTVVVGALGMLIGLFLIVTILTDLILAMKAIKGKIPYEWFILLPSGILLTVLNRVVVGGNITLIKGGVLLMIGGILLLLEGLKIKKIPDAKVMVTFFGIVIGLWETAKVVIIDSNNVWAWITAVIMLILLFILFLATGIIKLPEKIRPPLTWWLTLSIGIAMAYFGFLLSGIVILHVFLLILIDL